MTCVLGVRGRKDCSHISDDVRVYQRPLVVSEFFAADTLPSWDMPVALRDGGDLVDGGIVNGPDGWFGTRRDFSVLAVWKRYGRCTVRLGRHESCRRIKQVGRVVISLRPMLLYRSKGAVGAS